MNKKILYVLCVLISIFCIAGCNCIDNKQSKVYNNDKEIVNTVDTYTYKVCDGDLNNSGNRKKLTFMIKSVFKIVFKQSIIV